MSYFNYHAKAKRLIKDGHLVGYEFVDNWNGIKPALVLYFEKQILCRFENIAGWNICHY